MRKKDLQELKDGFKRLDENLSKTLDEIIRDQRKRIELLEWELNIYSQLKIIKDSLKKQGIDPNTFLKVKTTEQTLARKKVKN